MAGRDPTLLARERELHRQVNFWALQLATRAERADAETATTEARDKLASLLIELRGTDDRISTATPRAASLARPRALTLKEIEQHVLDANTVLLTFALGDRRSYGFAVTRTSFSAMTLPGRAQLERAARAVYDSMSAPGSGQEADTALAAATRLQP